VLVCGNRLDEQGSKEQASAIERLVLDVSP